MEIVHLTHPWGGGTQKYIDELCSLFPKNNHIINPQSFQLDQVKCFHIHSTMVGGSIGWSILRFFETKKDFILTIHDYQWLFPDYPNPTTEDFNTLICPIENIENFSKLVRGCKKVFFHTKNTLSRYEQFCGKMDFGNIIIEHPCDIPVNYERFYIPKIENIVHVGFLGGEAEHKGFKLLENAAHNMKNGIIFHVYGGLDHLSIGNILFHGPYRDETIVDVLRRNGIHILLALSLSEETYCYALTHMINTGIPIVFLNRGAISERLLGKSERFFPIEDNLEETIKIAIKYVTETGPIDKGEDFTEQKLLLGKSYKNIYD